MKNNKQKSLERINASEEYKIRVSSSNSSTRQSCASPLSDIDCGARYSSSLYNPRTGRNPVIDG